MSTHKHIDRICAAAALLSLLLALLFANGEALGLQPASRASGYEDRLFDTTRVHTVDIVMDEWDTFIETCENEEYSPCAVVIDGEAYQNIGLRAKGNTSLSTVSALGSDRYSFKLEFDHYETGKTYYGLDKLCLNNIIQDNTYMKDYLTYRLMASFGVAAPLCSYVYITVNGQDWGLYLAVEGVEEGFLQRNYGSQYGNLYKPDSTGFGGGRGNGQDFNMEDLDLSSREGFTPPDRAEAPEDMPQSFQPKDPGERGGPDMDGGPGGGMGSSDVKLQYAGDDPDSYANIFDNAKTELASADQARLIQSLKQLSQGQDLEDVLDMDQVLRYFVVHNFVVNGDSYTGSIVHNYYLYEEEGRLSMIPWDYNLAFGTFQSRDVSAAVNDPIDSPLSVTGDGSRPMIDWILQSEEYTRLYHQYFSEFLVTANWSSLIAQTRALIAPYVEKDPTKFCTYEEFEMGADALVQFCQLRTQSVSGQLAGSIPSTSEGQSGSPESLVDASGLTLSDMGVMSMNGGPDRGQPSGRPEGGGFPRGDSPGGRDAPDAVHSPGNSAQPSAQSTRPWLTLGLSTLILLVGLWAAFRYRRYGV